MIPQVVGVAEAEVGYLEKSKANYQKYGAKCLYPKTEYAGADNYTKYAYETGHANGQYWCQTFVNWCLMAAYGKDTADKLLCGMYDSPSTMDVKDAMLRGGREVPLSTAQPGDIVFRTRNGGGHVGLVKGWKGGKLVTIEGNTDGDASTWNGGQVAEHVGASWKWCCRPDYSLTGWHWVQADGKWYYQDSRGNNMHGWALIQETEGDASHWYFFDMRGVMQTGVLHIDGAVYYLMETGPLEGACCRTNDSGALEVWNL